MEDRGPDVHGFSMKDTTNQRKREPLEVKSRWMWTLLDKSKFNNYREEPAKAVNRERSNCGVNANLFLIQIKIKCMPFCISVGIRISNMQLRNIAVKQDDFPSRMTSFCMYSSAYTERETTLPRCVAL